MAAAEQWTRIERVVAIVTIVSAGLGLIVWIAAPDADSSLLLLAPPGLLSAFLAWRGRLAGHAIGIAFYAVQLAGYHPYHSAQAYPLRGALSLAFVVHLPTGVLIVNVFAIALLAASAALLWRRRRTIRAAFHNT